LFICLVLGSALIDNINNNIGHYIAKKVTIKLRNNVNQKIHQLPLAYFDQVNTGEIIAATTNDGTYVQDVFLVNAI
jgi:ATP-binding cassette subfamily B protein